MLFYFRSIHLRLYNVTRSFVKPSFIANIRLIHTLNEYGTLTKDGSTIVCLHLPEKISYDHTLPIPTKILDDTSVLKSKWDNDLKRVFKNVHPDIAREKLMALTFTTKHRWYPRSRDKKAKETPMDRDYL